jgi:hypothetical protein
MRRDFGPWQSTRPHPSGCGLQSAAPAAGRRYLKPTVGRSLFDSLCSTQPRAGTGWLVSDM